MKKLLSKEMGGSCAVVALLYISGAGEDTALRICSFHGFTPEDGMTDEEWQAAADDLGIKLAKVAMKSMRLGGFISKFKDGLFLVATHDHLFVVDNGVLIDPLISSKSLRRIVKQAWRVSYQR